MDEQGDFQAIDRATEGRSGCARVASRFNDPSGDIPEAVNWPDAKRGLFYRPVKKQITLRLDADVLAWFKRNAPGGRGYQTEINRALRQHVQRSENA